MLSSVESVPKWRCQTSLFATDGIRSFAMGYFSIIFVIVVRNLGLSALGLGIVTGVSVAVGIAITHFLTIAAYRHGARIALILSGLLMALTGVIIALAHSTLLLYAGALLGFLPPSGGMFIGALAEGVLAQTPPGQRTKVFARNGMIVTIMGAIGALFASFPTLLGMSEAEGLRLLIWLYSLLGVAVAAVSCSVIDLGPRKRGADLIREEAGDGTGEASFSGGSKTAINRLAALFVVDSAGSGIVAATLVIYWLRYHFNMSIVALSLLFFGMDVLAALSYPLAERISRRIGLLNTAVFTHIPSSILLMAVPFVPSAALASLLLLARALLVEMDIPTRKSYVASIVKPEERRVAAARTSMGRQAGRAIGPVVGGYLLSGVSSVAPFLGSGILKISYDLTLWRSFRSVSSREEHY